MNHELQNPTGIDIEIKRVQKKIYNKLKPYLSDINGYGRVYKNLKDDGFIPETFISGIEYNPVFSGEKSRFFFVKGRTRTDEQGSSYVESDVTIYFSLNLRELSESQRMDEQVLAYCHEAVRTSSFICKSIDQGVEEFVNDFKMLFKDKTNVKVSDFQPYHVFKMSGVIRYNLKNKC